MSQLKGKTALITGSTSGIGLGIAENLADAGLNIVMNGFGDADEIEKNRKAIEDKGVKCIYNGADMTKNTEIELMINEAVDTFGSIDILINNAGIQHVAPVEEFPESKWEAIIAINMSSLLGSLCTYMHINFFCIFLYTVNISISLGGS